jgi:hypothetical protein
MEISKRKASPKFSTSEKTFEILRTLNELLKVKCRNLEIRVGLMEEMTGSLSVFSEIKKSMLISLYNDNDCISSIQLNEFENGEIEIRSFTNTIHENKKYNTIIRCVLLLIGNTFTFNKIPITKVISHAVNIISAFSIIKNFEIFPAYIFAGNATDFSFFMQDEYNPSEDTGSELSNLKNALREFYKKYPNVGTFFEIPLTNEDLIAKSFDKFKILVGELDADNIANQIICPDELSSGKTSMNMGKGKKKYKKNNKTIRRLK